MKEEEQVARVKEVRIFNTRFLRNFVLVMIFSLLFSISNIVIFQRLDGEIARRQQIVLAEELEAKQKTYNDILKKYSAGFRNFGDKDHLTGTTTQKKMDDLKAAGLLDGANDKSSFSEFSSLEIENLKTKTAEVAAKNNWQNPIVTIKGNTNTNMPTLVFKVENPEEDIILNNEEVPGENDGDPEESFITSMLYLMKFTPTEEHKKVGITDSLSLVFDMNGMGGVYLGHGPSPYTEKALYGGLACDEGIDLSTKDFSDVPFDSWKEFITKCNVTSIATNQNNEPLGGEDDTFEKIFLPSEPSKSTTDKIIDFFWDRDKAVWVNLVNYIIPFDLLGIEIGDNLTPQEAEAIWAVVLKGGAILLRAASGAMLRKAVVTRLAAWSEKRLTKYLVKKLAAKGVSVTEREAAEAGTQTLMNKAIANGAIGKVKGRFLRGGIRYGIEALGIAAMFGQWIVMEKIAAHILGIAGCDSKSNVFELITGFNFNQVIANIINCLNAIILKPLLNFAESLLLQASGLSYNPTGSRYYAYGYIDST